LKPPVPVLSRGSVVRGGVVAAPSADLRRGPDHKSELLSQALFGEVVSVRSVSADRKWLRVATGDDRDLGWMRCWSVALGDVREWMPRHLVDRMWAGPSLPFGSRVLKTRSGVLGPLGPLKVPPSALAPVPVRAARRAAMVGAALRFLGVTYHWGGRTPAGLDCSGLVQLAALRHGIRLPRDAREQCAAFGGPGRLRPLGLAPAGALWFFGPNRRTVTHVAIGTGGLGLVHAYGWVRRGSLDPLSKVFEPELFRSCLGFAAHR
jgi:hypothetical protein